MIFTKQIKDLNIWFANKLANAIVFSGAVQFAFLASLNNKMLLVDGSGNIIGGPIVDTGGFISDSDIITAIVNATYNSSNNFTASIDLSTSGKTFNQGKWYNGGQYKYFAVGDNLVWRLTGA